MSEPINEDQKIASAKSDYDAFLKSFNEKHGYGIGASSEPFLNKEGLLGVKTIMQLVKLNIPPVPAMPPIEAENGAEPTPNGDSTPKETSAGDSAERDAQEAAQ